MKTFNPIEQLIVDLVNDYDKENHILTVELLRKYSKRVSSLTGKNYKIVRTSEGSMSLKGGLDMYSLNGEKRYQSEEIPEGRKVIYLQKNGWDGDQEFANRYFYKNDLLTIKEIYVGRSSSEVEFIEQPNERFNTVMFADVIILEEEGEK